MVSIYCTVAAFSSLREGSFHLIPNTPVTSLTEPSGQAHPVSGCLRDDSLNYSQVKPNSVHKVNQELHRRLKETDILNEVEAILTPLPPPFENAEKILSFHVFSCLKFSHLSLKSHQLQGSLRCRVKLPAGGHPSSQASWPIQGRKRHTTPGP